MSETRVKTVYTSCGCNRTPNILDWSSNNIICYGACNSILLWDPEAKNGQIIQTLIKHTNRVTSVRWIENNNYPDLLSSSTDGTAVLWQYTNGQYSCTAVLSGHEGPVAVADGIYINGCLYVVTASADTREKIWKQKDGGFTQIQTLNCNSAMCINVRLSKIRNENVEIPLLACSMANSQVNLYVGQIPENSDHDFNFELVETLKGHEGWIFGLDFTTDDDGSILLASCSKDMYIRIWKLSKVQETEQISENLDSTEDKIKMAKKIIEVKFSNEKKLLYSISLESILAGHEGWVYGVQWHPRVNGKQPMRLLSSSMDKTMIIWEQNPETEIWMDLVRVGEVGGNTLGFYGGKFSPDGQKILGHGYQGAFHLWNYYSEELCWKPGVVVSGHFNEVVDLGWEPQGEFLLTVSTDQTTRLHAPWFCIDNNSKRIIINWHEIARPQVHGYDMSCIAVLSRYKFASGAEEKVIRAFEAPFNFIENFHNICKIKNDGYVAVSNLPKGASVPSLGLSNKAVYQTEQKQFSDGNKKEEYPDTSYFIEVKLNEPPAEETLIQNTLWPEVQKLYGHGFELYALAATSDGSILASACKATKFEHAGIFLWDTNKWQQIQQLLSHNLTITQLAFSPDDKHLLSVSRDRRWSLFRRGVENSKHFELIACTDKKNSVHTRIIWCCAWSFDSKYFATGSRDGKAIIWAMDNIVDTSTPSGSVMELKQDSVTAIAIAPRYYNEQYLIAIGLESGVICLYTWSLTNGWTEIMSLNQDRAHHKTVKRLAFRPLLESRNNDILYLASCGSDFIVRIYEINLLNL